MSVEPAVVSSKGPLEIQATLARRVTVSAIPVRLPRGARILEVNLAISLLGATFQGWTQVVTNYTRIASTAPQALDENGHPETVTMRFEPGLIVVKRAAVGKVDVSGLVAIDTLMVPGGIAVDETVLRVPELFDAKGRPLAPDQVRMELVPLRHMPGFDQAEALLDADFVVQLRDGRRLNCSAAEGHIVVLDRDAVRQPYWDLGVAPNPLDRDSSRDRWLGLSRTDIGTVRAVFESPAAASAFATWIRMTRASRAGPFTLGVFNGPNPAELRPLVPIDKDIVETFRPLSTEERELMRVGPLGDR